MEDISKKSKFDESISHIKSLSSGAIRLSLIILFAVVAWRVAWSQFSLDLSKFDFSDLLAMILAIFAIGMSVAFYFKSTDSSNQFYDNIYNFTQKTSEILGRIEERFGERLKHLDEGYGRIQSRFDGVSKTPDEIKKEVKETEGKEEEEKQKLEQTNKALQKMMEQLTQRAKLQDQEKKEFYQEMERLTAEKDHAQARIREIEEDRDKMQHQLLMLERDMERGLHEMRNPILEEVFHHSEIRHLIRQDAPTRIIQKQSRKFFEHFPEEIIKELQEEGIVNKQREITAAGLMMIRAMSRRWR